MSASRLWFWTFATLSLLVGLVSLRWLVAPIAVVMPDFTHYLDGQALPLWVHIAAAPVAMLAAPFQLWRGLRARAPRLHRWTGYVYAVAVLLGGVSSLAMLAEFQGSAFAAAGFACLGTAWIAATAYGVGLARAGDFERHRRWMLRSVALTFAAVTLRVYMPFLIAAGWSFNGSYDVTAWLCWVPNLVAVELWLGRRRLRLRPA